VQARAERMRGAGEPERETVTERERRRMRPGLSAYWQRGCGLPGWLGASRAAHVTQLGGSVHPEHATSA